MDDGTNLVVETSMRIMQDLCTPDVVNKAEEGVWPARLWETLEESGLTLAWVPDHLGGAGAEVADGFGVLRVAGQFSAPVPMAETLLAGLLLTHAEIPSPSGPMSVAPINGTDMITLDPTGRLQGRARDIPFARAAQNLAVLVQQGGVTHVALVAVADCRISLGTSLAGEPRDLVEFDGVKPLQLMPTNILGPQSVVALGAAVRAIQMAGALERILNQSLEYAQDRVQFGRPISKFQVIQHNLAELAAEVAAASASADAAAEAVASDPALGEDAIAEIAVAKLRVGEAASAGSAFAHQVHGAMGFTYEHSLHHATRRLWAWRDEFGNESYWAILLGAVAARHGADGLWSFVTGTTQANSYMNMNGAIS